MSEWFTSEDWLIAGNRAVNEGSSAQDYADAINVILIKKYGTPADFEKWIRQDERSADLHNKLKCMEHNKLAEAK